MTSTTSVSSTERQQRALVCAEPIANGISKNPKPTRVHSPSPLKAYRISPSRRAKSAENIALREKEADSASPPSTPSPTKKSGSPLSDKFAKARKLFGIHRNGKTSYSRPQSTSLTDVSRNPPGSVQKSEPEDLSNPIGVSLSEGDADVLNMTYTIEERPPAAATNGLRIPKQLSARERRNGLNGLPKKRGLFNGNPFRNLNEQQHVAGVEAKHRAGNSCSSTELQ